MINYQKELDNITNTLTEKPFLALHSCCGPCSTYVLEYLTQYFNVTLFFYNPNIHPKEEYDKRLDAQKRVCEIFNVAVVECDYNVQTFFEKAAGLENEAEGGKRCEICFELRLAHTIEKALKSGLYDYVATTLTVSPHKNAQLINEIGERLTEDKNIMWLPSDFKKKNGYLRSTQLSKEHGIYRQDYCGCVYSKNNNDMEKKI